MSRIIPPLAALRAFEATCRLGRQSEAALELNVSTSAISHQIRALEAFLGISLYQRGPHGPVLNAAGENYYRQVGAALDILAKATEQQLVDVDETPLKIHMFQSLANLWFVPHLKEFLRANPDQRVIVQTIPEEISLPGSDVDAMIVYRRSPPDFAQVDLLFAEVTVPVCSPAYLQTNGSLNSRDDILAQPLISSSVYTDEWAIWARAAGAETAPPGARLYFDNRANVLEAAREGLGVALDRRPYGQMQISRGALVVPCALPQATGWSYYFVANERSHHSARIRRLRNWLLALCRGFAEPPQSKG